MSISIADASTVRPSTYNPRQADQERLDLVALSIKKLGWVLPIYADASGEILSGHQRHYVATEVLGLDRIPVSYTKAMNLQERKAINIVFNRGTNDMGLADTSRTLTEAMRDAGVHELAANLSDLDPSSESFFRCMSAEPVSTKMLMLANDDIKRPNAGASRMLKRRGIDMPIVIGPDNRVVNGIARLEYAAREGEKHIMAVRIGEHEVAFARVVLNLLTMDFDLHTRYADLLRHNSYRRARGRRKDLGRGFIFAMIGAKTTFDIRDLRHVRAWKRFYGTSIVDFGAGTLDETYMLRDAGVQVSSFEPFHILPNTDEVSPSASREIARAFLADVKAGKQWDTVFCSSVLQSVPFAEDRVHIINILAALAAPDVTVYACASHISQAGWKNNVGNGFVNPTDFERAQFRLDYEEGVLLGEFASVPKAMKFYRTEEFGSLFTPRFSDVQITVASNNVQAVAKGVILPSATDLAAALRFEFDLPYSDGSRMGLVDESLDAFSTRLGMEFPSG